MILLLLMVIEKVILVIVFFFFLVVNLCIIVLAFLLLSIVFVSLVYILLLPLMEFVCSTIYSDSISLLLLPPMDSMATINWYIHAIDSFVVVVVYCRYAAMMFVIDMNNMIMLDDGDGFDDRNGFNNSNGFDDSDKYRWYHWNSYSFPSTTIKYRMIRVRCWWVLYWCGTWHTGVCRIVVLLLGL